MEKHNFLQRPGGLGPMAERVKPIGTLATEKPAAYANTPEAMEFRRATTLDDINRIYTQYRRDRGEYAREAIGPISYGEGNITESAQLTGLAGYNHKDSLQTPMRPLDMNKAEYLVTTQNTMDPNLRGQLQVLTNLPEQNFMNSQDLTYATYPQSYRMPDSLPLQLLGGNKQ